MLTVRGFDLACHPLRQKGYPQDLAYDFKVGDLRGMYAMFIPDDMKQAIQNSVRP